MRDVVWFETSDGRYWVKLPNKQPWPQVMVQVVAMWLAEAGVGTEAAQ